jgi:hypothetical protein
MKIVLQSGYSFNAATKEIDFSGYASFDKKNLLAVINTTKEAVIYAVGSPNGASWASNVATLDFDTTTHSNSDVIQIFYDEPNANLSSSVQTSQLTVLNNLLSELELKANLFETQPVSISSLPLPSGSATSANQITTNGKLDNLLTELQLKADLSEIQPVSAASLPLPSGAATSANQVTTNSKLDTLIAKDFSTSAKQDTGNSFLSNIDGHTANIESYASTSTSYLGSIQSAITNNEKDAGSGIGSSGRNVLIGGMYRDSFTETLSNGDQCELAVTSKGILKVQPELTPIFSALPLDVNFPSLQFVSSKSERAGSSAIAQESKGVLIAGQEDNSIQRNIKVDSSGKVHVIDDNSINGSQLTKIYDGTSVIGSVSSGGSAALMTAQSATNFIFSSGNSFNTTLSGGATITGSIVTTLNQQAYSILIKNNQIGNVFLYMYIDAAGTQLAQTITFSAAAGGFARSGVVNGNYFKLQYQNASGISDTVVIDTYFGTIPSATQLNNAPISLNEVNGTNFTLGQKTMVNSLPVVLSSDQASIPVTVSGVATSALQTTGNTSLGNIDSRIGTTNTGLGSIADSVATTDTGTFSLIALTKKIAQNITSLATLFPTSLGQKAAASSLAVTLSNENVQDQAITGQSAQTATVNNILTTTSGSTATDTTGYRSFAIQVISTGTSGNFIFESSNDNINFVTCPVNNLQSQGAPIAVAITATASAIIYIGSCTARYLRLRIGSTIGGGSIQAFTILSQNNYNPLANLVQNATAANLNATVSIAAAQTLATVTTVGTVTTCSTVSSVTAANLASGSVTDIASAAITVTSTSGAISMANTQAIVCSLAVTAVSGTAPTMDVVVQETFDGGTNWVDVYHFERITATGSYNTPLLKLSGTHIRYVQTIAGTTPSFTRGVVRVSRSLSTPAIRRFFDRTISVNSLNATTSSMFIQGCNSINVLANMAAGGTPPVFTLEGSEDNSNWFTASGTTIDAVAGGFKFVTFPLGIVCKFVRLRVSTAGTGSTLNYLTVTARD